MKLEFEKIDATYRTNIVTFATTCALVIVNLSAEVFNLNCICRTNLRTLHTADTACLTLFSCNSTLFVVFAKNCCFFHVEGEEVNKTAGTSFNAHLTSLTLIRVDSCNAVAKEDSLIRTNLYTVTETDTAVYAVFRSAEKLSCNLAGFNTAVLELFFYIIFVTLAHNCCYHWYHFACGETHNISYCLCGVVTAGDTKSTFLSFALSKSTCIAVTACVTAGTAVSTGKRITDGEELFILFDTEENVRNGKYDRANDRDRKTDKNGNKYCHNFLPPYARRFSTIPAKP